MSERATSHPPARSARWGAFWLVIGAATCAAMARLEPNLLEEGLMLHVGERLLGGEHLYSDIRLVTGPIPYAIVALCFSLFGIDVAAARMGVVILHGLATASVYGMARRTTRPVGAHVAAAIVAFAPVLFFPLLSMMFYTTVATSLAIIACYVALRGIESPRWAIAAGVAVAVTALSKQTTGAMLAITLMPILWLCAPVEIRARVVAGFCVGGALATILTLTFFAALGDLGVFVASLLERPQADVFGSSFINLWPPGRLAPTLQYSPTSYLPTLSVTFGEIQPGGNFSLSVLTAQLLFVMPFVALLLAVTHRLAGPMSAAAWVLTALVIGLATNLYPRADWGHLVFVAPTSLAFAAVLGFGLLGASRARWERRVAAAAITGLALGTAAAAGGLYAISGEPSYGERVGVRPVSPQLRNEVVPRVLRYLEERLAPGEPIFVARAEPLVYFALQATNPTPFTGALQVWGLRHEQQDEILAALEDVRFVVMSDIDEPLFTYFSDELPRVQRYLERHFRVPELFKGRELEDSWLLVLERRADRGASAFDLLDPALAPRAWLRSPAGGLEVVGAPFTNLPTLQNHRPLVSAVGPVGGGIDYLLDLPAAAHFQAGIGYGHIRGYLHPERADFVVSVAAGDDFEELASWRVDLGGSNGSRSWSPIDVDLSRFGGRRVTLRLEVRPDLPQTSRTFASWGSARIVSESGAFVAPEAMGATPAGG